MRIHNPTITGSLALSGSSLTIDTTGTLSGSATSTGSFGRMSLGRSAPDSSINVVLDVDGQAIFRDTPRLAASKILHGITGAGTLRRLIGFDGNDCRINDEHQNIIMGAAGSQITIGGHFANVSGSATSTGSFGAVAIGGTFSPASLEKLVVKGDIGLGNSSDARLRFNSGASRGHIGPDQNVELRFGFSNTSDKIFYHSTTEVAKINGNGITVSSGNVSGSSTSTGSFGTLNLGESSHIHTLSIKGQSEESTGIRVRHPSDDTLFEVKASEDDGRLRLFANNS